MRHVGVDLVVKQQNVFCEPAFVPQNLRLVLRSVQALRAWNKVLYNVKMKVISIESQLCKHVAAYPRNHVVFVSTEILEGADRGGEVIDTREWRECSEADSAGRT